MIILFVCVCVCLRFTEHLFSWLLIPSTKPHLMLNLFICSEELARGGDTLCSAPFYLFFGCFFFFFDLFSWSIEVFYFAQIIHKFCEGGGRTYRLTDISMCDTVCLSGGWWWCWWGKENQTPRLFQWTALILNLTHLHLLTYLHCSLIPTVKFVVWIGDATHARLLFLPVIAEVTGWWWIGNVWSHTRTQPIMFTLCTHII